jgi:hypothetical protein
MSYLTLFGVEICTALITLFMYRITNPADHHHPADISKLWLLTCPPGQLCSNDRLQAVVSKL